jgi:hypothetical protein
MSDHEDVLRMMRDWIDPNVPELRPADSQMIRAIDATLAELVMRRSEVGILSAAKAGARYIAERDTLRQRLAEVERERDDLRGELASVLRDWNALVHAIGSPTHGGAAGHARILRERADRAERAEKALRPFAAFADAWDRKPIRGIHDEVYAIHAGADRGVLRLSDCKAARAALAPVAEPEPRHREEEHFDGCSEEVECDPCMNGCYHRCGQALPCPAHGLEGAPTCVECGERWPCSAARSATAPVAEQPADARNLPAGTLVTCEHCPDPHPLDDDGTKCKFPKVAEQQHREASASVGLDRGDCGTQCVQAPQPAKASTEPAACTSCGGTRLLTSGHGYRPCHCSQDDGGVPHV